jgi:nucleotide-binding universal stress UspA family protein
MSINEERILFPVDLLPLDELVMDQVTRAAKDYGAGLHLYHVLSSFSDLPLGFPVPLDIYEQISRVASQQLELIAQDFLRRDVPVSLALYRGEANEVTLSLASSGDKGLIILISRGKGALGRIFLGSTSTSIIHHSPLPVLLLKSKDILLSAKNSYKDIPLPENIYSPGSSTSGESTPKH